MNALGSLRAAPQARSVFIRVPAVPAPAHRVELHFHHAALNPDGTAQPLRLRVAMPLLTLPVPRRTPIVPIRPPRIEYPESSMRGGAAGTVVLDFVVDGAGRVDPASVREIWPPDRPRLTGELGRFYDAFVRAATRGLAAARYEPMRVGGCPVRSRARQEFVYDLR